MPFAGRSRGMHTHILALLSQRKNKGRLPASGKDASHPESHVDADSVSLGRYSQFGITFQLIRILPPWISGSAVYVFSLGISNKKSSSALTLSLSCSLIFV